MLTHIQPRENIHHCSSAVSFEDKRVVYVTRNDPRNHMISDLK